MYLDNIVIYSSYNLEHLQYIVWVLTIFRSNPIFTKPKKKEYNLNELEGLGHVISSGTVKPYLKKSEAISMRGFSTNTKEIQGSP